MTSVLLDLESGDNQNRTIDRLVELKSSKSKLLQEEIDNNRRKIVALEDFEKKVRLLDTVTKGLYDRFDRVKDFALTSSDDKVISGTASAKAVPGSYEFEVLELANKQVLQSRKIAADLRIPKGKIKFKVNDEEFEVDYLGGDPNDFAKVLTKNSQGTVEASFIRVNEKENYFVMQAAKGGEKNKIIVLEDRKKLLEEVGIFKKQPPIYKRLVNYASLAEEYNLSITNKSVQINNETQLTIAVDKEIDFKHLEKLSFRFKSDFPPDFDEDTPIGFVTYTKAGEQKKKPIPYKKNRNGYFTLNQYFLNSSIDPKVHIDSFTFVNSSVSNKFYYGTIWQIIRPEEDKRFLPEKVVSEPTTSRFKFHSLIIERDSNNIDDFLTGVNLDLLSVSDKKVKIEVIPKNENLEQKIINFINSFNLVIETINIYTAPNLEALGVEERQLGEEFQDKVGILANENSVVRLRERLRDQLAKVYFVDKKTKIIPSMVGLTYNFNFSNPYDLDVSKIEFEEEKFVEYNQQNPEKLKNLFGRDSDSNRIIDKGLAFEINEILANYLKPNTFFGVIEENLKRQNDSLDRALTREEENLAEYRQELEVNFSKLDNARKEQENLQNWFEGLNQ